MTALRKSYLHLLVVVIAVLGTLTVASLLATSRATAGGSGSDLGSNGQHRRPFYVFGHNPNQLSEVSDDLNAGANALEPDVMRFSDSAVFGTSNLNSQAGPSGLFMYHDHVLTTTRFPTTVEGWLDVVHNDVVNGANVALIAFDIKSAAAQADLGLKLLQAVRSHLNYGTVNVNVIFSVAGMSDNAVFSQIIPLLGPREGVMIDAENDPGAVYNYFASQGATGHIAYGNGSLGVRYGFAPNVLLGIEAASWTRAGQVPALAIPYAYPIDLTSDMNAFITAGADGLIPDVDFPIVAPSDTQDHIATLVAVVNGRNDVYMASAAENPFQPRVEAYGLRVVTQNKSGAGTDANLTFTLTGCNGTSSVTVRTDYIGHMEDGDVNYVTLPSKDLGRLRTLTLSSDGANGGVLSTQAWDPGLIEISSANWGIPYSDHRGVSFTAEVDAGSPQSMSLGGWGDRCESSTSLSTSVNPSVYGQPITLTGTVAGVTSGSGTPTGTVNLLDGTTSIGSGTLIGGSFAVTTAALSVGHHSITAAYSGDAVFLPSTSTVIDQNVNRSPTTTVLTFTPPVPSVNQPVTFTAVVHPQFANPVFPTGDVSFFIDGSAIPTASVATVNGQAVFTTTFGGGPHTVVAVYAGDGNYLSSTSAGGSFTVPCDVTITGTHSAFTVRSGTTCVLGATVTGGISFVRGAVLDLENSSVNGSISAGSPAGLRICGSTTASIGVSGATGFVRIGDPANNCTANRIDGSLIAANNKGGGTISGNTITGSWTITANTPTFIATGNHH